MDRNTELVQALLAQLQRLTSTNTTDTPAVRLTVHTETGDIIGEIPLPETSAEALMIAAMSTADYADMDPAAQDDTLRIFDATVTDLHPDAVKELEGALAGVTVDPNQVGISDLHTALHFRDLARDFITARTHALLVADIEDHFDSVDQLSYLDDVMTADEPESAAAAYEQLITGEWDGDL